MEYVIYFMYYPCAVKSIWFGGGGGISYRSSIIRIFVSTLLAFYINYFQRCHRGSFSFYGFKSL